MFKFKKMKKYKDKRFLKFFEEKVKEILKNQSFKKGFSTLTCFKFIKKKDMKIFLIFL